jgi:methionine biosynthesis protein MetW
MEIDDSKYQDNRQYKYPIDSTQQRAEYSPISEWIKAESKVVDFGCGDGSLLNFLKINKKISSLGYDISQSGIEACKRKSIDAICDRIDKVHPELKDKSFDYAICNVTLQMVDFPEVLLSEMQRVAIHQILSFPNFAYYENRLDLLIRGRMPRPMMFGYDWFSTGHIHQLSIQDFRLFVQHHSNLKIKKERHIGLNSAVLKSLVPIFPNLLSKISIFLLSSL